jgi:putative transcriptional regulator
VPRSTRRDCHSVFILTLFALGSALLWPVPVETAGVEPAPGRFLVARAQLPDPNFFEAVVLLLDYDEEEGALGVVVNRRSGLAVGTVVPEGEPLSERQDPLYLGGPVSLGTMTVLMTGTEPPASADRIIADVYLIRDRAGLEALVASGPAAEDVRFYAGYAGWARGQLEDEISRGVWHLLPGDPRWVFTEEPGRTWDRLLGIIFGPTA